MDGNQRAAVLVNVQVYVRIKETPNILKDPILMTQIAKSRAFYKAGTRPARNGSHSRTFLVSRSPQARNARRCRPSAERVKMRRDAL